MWGWLVDKEIATFLSLSDKLLVKLLGRPFDISIITVYAPTSESTDEDMDSFYGTLDKSLSQCRSHEIIMLWVILLHRLAVTKQIKLLGNWVEKL